MWRGVDVCSRKYTRTDTCTFKVTVNELVPLIPRVCDFSKFVGIGDRALLLYWKLTDGRTVVGARIVFRWHAIFKNRLRVFLIRSISEFCVYAYYGNVLKGKVTPFEARCGPEGE
jgi:hypothetical protein